MESLDFDELKNIVKGLLSETSCPVCFNTLRSPVRLCTNGHGVCAACQPALEHCPLCAEPFSASSSKSVLLNGMLDLLPHTCKFDGCEVLVKPVDDHETWCGYQMTKCRVSSCQWTGCAKDILEHIKANHDEIILRELTVDSSGGLLKLPVSDDGFHYYLHNSIFFSKVLNGLWIIIIQTFSEASCKLISVHFNFIPNGEIKTVYLITLAFGPVKKSFSSSLKVTPGVKSGIDAHMLTITCRSMDDLADQEGNIPFRFSIKKIRHLGL